MARQLLQKGMRAPSGIHHAKNKAGLRHNAVTVVDGLPADDGEEREELPKLVQVNAARPVRIRQLQRQHAPAQRPWGGVCPERRVRPRPKDRGRTRACSCEQGCAREEIGRVRRETACQVRTQRKHAASPHVQPTKRKTIFALYLEHFVE